MRGIPQGFPKAIETIYPQTEVQKCVSHQIRNSMKYFAFKHQKAFIADLKCVYKAATFIRPRWHYMIRIQHGAINTLTPQTRLMPYIAILGS